MAWWLPISFVTDGHSRTLKIDGRTVRFRYAGPSVMRWAGKPPAPVVQALRWLNPDVAADLRGPLDFESSTPGACEARSGAQRAQSARLGATCFHAATRMARRLPYEWRFRVEAWPATCDPCTTREKTQDCSQAWVSYDIAPALKPNMTKAEPMTTEHELLTRITARPEVFGGKPIIRDMRISVELILSLLAQGVSHRAILDDYSDLEPEDIRACNAYARAVIAGDTLAAVSVRNTRNSSSTATTADVWRTGFATAGTMSRTRGSSGFRMFLRNAASRLDRFRMYGLLVVAISYRRRYDHHRRRDAGDRRRYLEVISERVRLKGIDAPEKGQLCENASGNLYPCGQERRHGKGNFESLSLTDLIGLSEPVRLQEPR